MLKGTSLNFERHLWGILGYMIVVGLHAEYYTLWCVHCVISLSPSIIDYDCLSEDDKDSNGVIGYVCMGLIAVHMDDFHLDHGCNQ